MYRLKNAAQNLAFALFVLMNLANMTGLYIRLDWTLNFYNYIAPFGLMTHRVLAFTLGFVGLLISVNLYRRMRSAWILAMVEQSIMFGLHIVYSRHVFSMMALISLFILLVLGFTFNDFKRRTERERMSQAIVLACVPLLVAVANTIVTVQFLYHNYHDFWHILRATGRFLFLMDLSGARTYQLNVLYLASLIVVSWVCFLIAIFLFLKPLVYNPIVNNREHAHVFRLVERYGLNPMAYMALMRDKHYFFGELVEGVIAYTVVNNVMVIAGDVICAKRDAVVFIGEILAFAHKNRWRMLFLDTTEDFREAYESNGFSMVKIGEDACIRLEDYTMKGKNAAKARANINHARRLGVEVKEYQPHLQHQAGVEHYLNEISREWFQEKGPEMGFMLGGLELANPQGRRYFYAQNADGRMLGFVVFVPYDQGRAYMADVTRRRSDAPNGTMEIIMFEAFTKMKEEGVTWGNLGLCPLANIGSDETNNFTTQIFEFIYENLNGIYGFKGLYQAKKKFAPTDWQARYVAYAPRPFVFSYAYAIIKAQNPKGINKLILEKLRSKFDRT